ncbi:apolipoprotein N-acyltransferase, partial [bacterium]|nr:apolipoprotein N-acyltransferase [bacterium]
FGIFGAFAAVAGNPWREKTPLARSVPQRFREMGRSLGFAVVLGGFWCGMEWIRGWMLTGFGWNGLGVAFSKSLMLAQNAEFVGVIGLAFLPVFLSAVVVQVGCRFYQQSIIGGVKMLHWDFASGLLVVMGAFTLGTFRFVAINSSEKITAKVLLVQQNIPQKAGQILWSRQEIVDGFVELTEDGIEQAENNTVEALKTAEKDVAITSGQPDFVVWPEACLPEWFDLDEEGVPTSGPDMESIIGYAASLGNFTLLSGINEVEGNPADPSSNVYNSLLALDPSGRRQSFKKHHLVYFGEAIPDIEALRDLYERTTGVPFGGGLTPGSGFEPFELSWKDEKIGAIPSICFEDTVPRLTRKFVRAEPQMIVNVTNDGWFQESEAAEQHFENALFRCIELRRPMLRSANQGVTCVISVVGSTYDPVTNEDRRLVDEKGSHFQRGSLLANIYLPTPQNEAQSSLAIFGIEKPKTITLAGTSGPVLIEFGSGDLNHFYSNRIGTARVAEVTSQIFTKIAMEDFRWRSKRIWSIDPFEIRGLVIERKGRPVLQLSYNFFSRQWKAREGGKDITARLNVNKANRLLEKLSDIKAHRWLGPDAQNATFLLNDPNLSISVSLEEVDDTGKVVALVPHQLKVAQIVSGAKNRFYYASLSSDPDFFLIDVGTVKSLAVELIE